jgi:hypothetical protein
VVAERIWRITGWRGVSRGLMLVGEPPCCPGPLIGRSRVTAVVAACAAGRLENKKSGNDFQSFPPFNKGDLLTVRSCDCSRDFRRRCAARGAARPAP